jgi:hypothetical protein
MWVQPAEPPPLTGVDEAIVCNHWNRGRLDSVRVCKGRRGSPLARAKNGLAITFCFIFSITYDKSERNVSKMTRPSSDSDCQPKIPHAKFADPVPCNDKLDSTKAQNYVAYT